MHVGKNIGETFDDLDTTLVTVTGEVVTTPNLVDGIEAYEHLITPLVNGISTTGIDATGKNLSSMLICRLFRDVSNGYTGNGVFLLEIDFHYQIDSDGSHEQYTKY